MLAKWLDSRVRTSWHQKTLTMALAFSLLIVGPVSADPVEDPTVVTEDSKDVLLLPDALQTLIQTQFPGFRVPDNSDLTSFWGRFKVPGSFPFILLGDFNGDSIREDVALILISNSAWKMVIFNKETSGYTAALEIGNTFDPITIPSPQSLIIGRINQGEDFEIILSEEVTAQGEVEQITFQFHADNDSLRFGVWEQGAGIIHWEDGEYKDQPLGGH